MNIVEVVGRLVRDPELKRVGERNWPILTLNMAVDDATGRWNPDTRKTEVGSGFYQMEVSGPYAERVHGWNLSRGDQVWVKGSLSQWRGKKDDGSEGEPRTRIQVAVCELLGAKQMKDAARPQIAQQQGWDPSWPPEPTF